MTSSGAALQDPPPTPCLNSLLKLLFSNARTWQRTKNLSWAVGQKSPSCWTKFDPSAWKFAARVGNLCELENCRCRPFLLWKVTCWLHRVTAVMPNQKQNYIPCKSANPALRAVEHQRERKGKGGGRVRVGMVRRTNISIKRRRKSEDRALYCFSWEVLTAGPGFSAAPLKKVRAARYCCVMSGEMKPAFICPTATAQKYIQAELGTSVQQIEVQLWLKGKTELKRTNLVSCHHVWLVCGEFAGFTWFFLMLCSWGPSWLNQGVM